MEQVYAVCDRITVLRNGHFVGEYKTEELPRFKLVATMMGKEFDDLADIKGSGTSSKKQSDEVVIEAKVFIIKERSNHLTLRSIKEKLLDYLDY